jgi:hypothetical protein
VVMMVLGRVDPIDGVWVLDGIGYGGLGTGALDWDRDWDCNWDSVLGSGVRLID